MNQRCNNSKRLTWRKLLYQQRATTHRLILTDYRRCVESSAQLIPIDLSNWVQWFWLVRTAMGGWGVGQTPEKARAIDHPIRDLNLAYTRTIHFIFWSNCLFESNRKRIFP